MAEIKKVLKARKPISKTISKSSRKPSRKPRSKTGGKAVSRAVNKAQPVEMEATAGVEENCQNGVKLLRDAVNREVVLQSDRIAHGLAEKARSGNTACAKLIVELMEARNAEEKPGRKRGLLSEAQRLALEPAWKDEDEETAGSDR